MSTTTITAGVPRDSARARRNGFLGAYLGWLFDGYETFATVLVASVVVNDLVGPGQALKEPLYVGGILATTLVAWACGGLLSGILADRLGRRRVMLWSIVWYAAFAGLTALAPSYALLLVLRFLSGLGMGAEWGAGSSLVAELSDPKRRGRRIALLQSGFGVGFLIATGLWQLLNNGGAGDWRWMYVIGVVPALLTVFIRRSVEDPDLWSAVDERRRSASARLAEGADVPAAERELTRPTIQQLLGHPGHRRRVGVLLVAAFGTTLGWWAVSSWVPQFAGQEVAGKVSDVPDAITLVVLAYNAAGVLGYLTMGWLADVVGRKRTLAAYFAGSLVVTPLLFLVPDTHGALIAFAALNGFFTLGQWTWMALYPSELFPTNIRATAMTVVFNAARFAAAAGALLSATLITTFGSISTAAIVIGCVAYGIGLLAVPFLGPETTGRPLPTPEAIGDDARPLADDRPLTPATTGGAA